MKTSESDQTIKIRPLYNLLLLGVVQLFGAFTIYRLGVLKIKETWINQICLLAVLGLIGWAFYLFYSFSTFYKLKDDKIVLRKNNFLLFGIEIDYNDVKEFGINTKDSVLSLNIYLNYLKEPIPVVAKFMKLKEFHLLLKTLIEKTGKNPF